VAEVLAEGLAVHGGDGDLHGCLLGAGWKGPQAPAAGAGGVALEVVGAAGDAERQPIAEGPGDLLVRRIEEPPESLAGDAHPECGPFLVQPFGMGKPKGLCFFNGENDFLLAGQRDVLGLESQDPRKVMDSFAAWRAGQGGPPRPIMGICSLFCNPTRASKEEALRHERQGFFGST